MKAVILAGGKGTRLRPYTMVLPKPLMPIGDMPVLEIVIRQLKRYGFNEINIAAGYMAELLQAYLMDGRKYGLKINYSVEDKPLSTIGPLALMDNLKDSFLVMNGDILTDLDYSKLVEFHKHKSALATIATFKRTVNIDFGVLMHDKTNKIKEFLEKPTYTYDVSMGIYVFEPAILEYIPKNRPFGFDELMKKLIENDEEVYSYNYNGYWLDIGRPDDYEQAVNEFENLRHVFLRED